MNPKKTALMQIGFSLFFAAAMIVSAYLLKGTEYQEMARNWLIAIWCVPFFYLAGKGAQGAAGKCKRNKCC